MAKNWTEEQLAAIEAIGKLTVLSAAAGSGKTTVLVEKALRIILDEDNPVSADRLLIVTFSNASAKEFKNRIEKGINERIKKQPSNSYIKSQKVALQRADICTIHSFCIKLVRENFAALGIPSDFTICDDAQGAVLHEKAIDKAMKYGYTMEAFCKFVSIFGKSSQDKQVREFLKEMYHYFSALPFPKSRARELSSLNDGVPFNETEIYRYLKQLVTQKCSYALYLAQRQQGLLEQGDFSGYDEAVELDNVRMKKLLYAAENGDYQSLNFICNEDFVKLGTAKPKCDSSIAVQNVRKRLKETVEDIQQTAAFLDEEKYCEQNAQTSAYLHTVTEVFISYLDILFDMKKQKKTFEFTDFEHMATQLLIGEDGRRTPFAHELQEKYYQIMEDEFQDTSYVQDMIFKSIAKDNESNLFIVGDVKQSIYTFRKASPEILLKKRQKGLDFPSQATTIFLPHNFRSQRSVIDGINHVFERIMTEQVGSVDYKQGEQLLAPKDKPYYEEVGVSIALCYDDEPQYVAKTIKDMLSSGFEIQDGNEKRKACPQDFCILLRNKKMLGEYSSQLKKLGIASFVKDDELILAKTEVESIISLLRVANNPLQEVYVTAGMFGDVFGFSLDEILEIKVKSGYQNLYKALSLCQNERAKEFLKLLKEFSWAANIYSADKLISYIIKRTGYYSRLAFAENGKEKRENIRWFISFAKNYANLYQSTLNGFIRWIDLHLQNGKGDSSVFQKPEKAVSIMTMHTSKGLEFPICFVSGLATKFNKMDATKRLMMDTQLGMATYCNKEFGYNSSTAGIKAIKEKILSSAADDEMRLLYVAMTRAKNQLFLTAQFNNIFTPNTISRIAERTSKDVHYYAVRKANNPIEWVLTALINTEKVNQTGFLHGSEACFDSFLNFKIVENMDTELSQEEPEQELFILSLQQKQQMLENLSYKYHNYSKTLLPIKVSVSEIAKAPPPLVLKKPSFARQQQYTAAEKGTAMHLFVQHCDIALARLDFDSELNRLCNKNLINKELLDIEALKIFLTSKTANVILNSEKVFTEKDFLVPYNAAKALGNEDYEKDELLVQGVIDCVAITGEKAMVIDYKTDRVNHMDQLVLRYKKQLELYRYAARHLFEVEDVKCVLYSFYLGKEVEL